MLKIKTVISQKDIDNVKFLFLEYLEYLKTEFHAYKDLPWMIDYYKEFEKEIEGLPGNYSPPSGCILLVEYNSQPIGCVALDKHSHGICEMKRLYIKPEFHRRGIGTVLCKALIDKAIALRYSHMRLGTALENPKHLYRALGFREIRPYNQVPLQGAIFMELKLI
jgi:ribosomal protein S18 acetylase RimI-like enzyme